MGLMEQRPYEGLIEEDMEAIDERAQQLVDHDGAETVDPIVPAPGVRSLRRVLGTGAAIVVVCGTALGVSWESWWPSVAPVSIKGTVDGQGNVHYEGDLSKVVDLHTLRQSFTVNTHGPTGYCGQQTSRGQTMVCCVQSPYSPSLSFECSPVCFPGEARIQVEGRGQVPIDSVVVGDNVLVELRAGHLAYESVLGYLHSAPANTAEFVTVTHGLGQFRASANHLVFKATGPHARASVAVGNLAVGDRIFATSNHTSDTEILESRVLSLHKKRSVGVYAPLTASGSVVVDGVVASIYASPSLALHLPHAAAHAAFFSVRAYHSLGLATLWATVLTALGAQPSTSEEMHPFANLLHMRLGLGFLLRAS